MHLVLTDVLICPKCGPPTGLIVLADQMAGRRVLEGKLGCPSCEQTFPVREGVVDLSMGEQASLAAGAEYAGDALRLAALAGLTEPRGFSLVVGPAAALAEQIVALVPNLQLVVLGHGAGLKAAEGVSPLLVAGPFPLQDSSMRGVILTGPLSESWLRESARVVAGGARVVIESDGLEAALVERCGLKVLVAEGNTVVATRAM